MGCLRNPLDTSFRMAVLSALPHCIKSLCQLANEGQWGDFHLMVRPLIASIRARSWNLNCTFWVLVRFRSPTREAREVGDLI